MAAHEHDEEDPTPAWSSDTWDEMRCSLQESGMPWREIKGILHVPTKNMLQLEKSINIVTWSDAEVGDLTYLVVRSFITPVVVWYWRESAKSDAIPAAKCKKTKL